MTGGTQGVLVLIVAVLSSTVLGAAVTALVTWKLGVRGDERGARQDEQTAKRDEMAATDALLARVMERLRQVEARQGELEQAKTAAEEVIRGKDDHIDVLEAHIWQRLPPPPPPRPVRA